MLDKVRNERFSKFSLHIIYHKINDCIEGIWAASSAGYHSGHVSSLTVTLTTGLSASDHLRDVISKSTQTLYALRVLRAKGMPNEALQVVFRSVIVGKLLYASCAWSGFVSHTVTLIGSASTHSCIEVNAVDFVRRTCRGLTNYLKTPTLGLLSFIKSPLTVVMSCISFYHHFRRPHRTIVCVIEYTSSACRTTQDAYGL